MRLLWEMLRELEISQSKPRSETGLSPSMKTDDFHKQIENHLSAYFPNGLS